MFKAINVAGLTLSATTKQDILTQLETWVTEGKQVRVVTPYSEFLQYAMKDPSIMAMLSSADVAIADGVGIVWAAHFLNIPLPQKNKVLRLLRSIWQMITSGARILLAPRSIYTPIPEKIVGADFFWDLAGLAEKQNQPIFLLGGFEQTPNIVAEKLRERFPNIRIGGISNSNFPGNEELLQQIRASNAGMLFVAWGPIRQEQWIMEHIHNLPNIRLAIGLGATFDYIAGTKSTPPKLIRQIGLEWLFRLITQPYRYKRIYNATIGLISSLVWHKVNLQ